MQICNIQRLFDLKAKERKMFEVEDVALVVLKGVWLCYDSMAEMGVVVASGRESPP